MAKLDNTGSTAKPHLAWIGFATGAIALIMAIFIFWAGPFAPQQSAGVSLGELAAEIAKSAARNVAGLEQPAVAVPARDLDDYLRITVGLLGSIAVVLGVGAMVRNEARRHALAAIGLGASAIVFQFFVWYAIALLGVLLIWAVMSSLGNYFDGLFQ